MRIRRGRHARWPDSLYSTCAPRGIRTKASRFFGIYLISLWHLAAVAHASTTNCKRDELVVFSCASAARVISYCAAPTSATETYIEYRYSSNGKPGLVYRDAPGTNDRKLKRAHVRGASASTTALWFTNSGYTYVLNDPVRGTPFVEVRKAGRQVSQVQCGGNIEGDAEMPNKLIEERTSDEYFDLFRQN
jgi:hypothetical protein